MRWSQKRREMLRFVASQPRSAEPSINPREYEAYWQQHPTQTHDRIISIRCPLARARQDAVENLNILENAKYWLTQVGFPPEPRYFYFDTLPFGVPAVAEFKDKNFQTSTYLDSFLHMIRRHNFPTWSDRLRLIGYSGGGELVCLEEEMNGIATYLNIWGGAYWYLNASVTHLAQCLLLYHQWADLVEDEGTGKDRRITYEFRDRIRSLDPLTMDERFGLWHHILKLDWLEEPEENEYLIFVPPDLSDL